MNTLNPQPSTLNRLPATTVDYIHRLVGGDPVTEDRILRFIAAQYGAKNLFYLPPNAAAQVRKRPADFIRAANQYCQPELW